MEKFLLKFIFWWFFVSYWVSNRATGLYTREMDVDFTFWSPRAMTSQNENPPPYGMVSVIRISEGTVPCYTEICGILQ